MEHGKNYDKEKKILSLDLIWFDLYHFKMRIAKRLNRRSAIENKEWTKLYWTPECYPAGWMYECYLYYLTEIKR